jgi:hypothetical protein
MVANDAYSRGVTQCGTEIRVRVCGDDQVGAIGQGRGGRFRDHRHARSVGGTGEAIIGGSGDANHNITEATKQEQRLLAQPLLSTEMDIHDCAP